MLYVGREYNFNKYSRAVVTTFNLTYDYGSVMHYSEKAFSNNGSPTITALVRKMFLGSSLHFNPLLLNNRSQTSNSANGRV